LRAVVDELGEGGPAALPVDRVAARAGVSKATIYRWWRSKHEVVLEALVDALDTELDLTDTGFLREDLRRQMCQLVTTMTGDLGTVIRTVIAAGQGDNRLNECFRRQVLAKTRGGIEATFARGVVEGEISGSVDLDVAVDALVSPLWMRLVLGHATIDRDLVDKLIDTVLDGVLVGEREPAAAT
jgi:AcrR family transcriptional regulator